MKNELISIIIPTFNRSNYLPIAIDSVLNQTYSNYELIIIDDGSTDDTHKIIQEKYKDKIIYICQENQGESKARNKGISLAKGKYIAFLDSDDFWSPKKLETQVYCFSSAKQNGLVGVFSPVWIVDENGDKIYKKPKGTIRSSNDLRYENLLTNNIVYGSSSNLLLETDRVRQIGGFDHTIQYGEDRDFLLRLRQKGNLKYISTPLTFIRKHRKNQSLVFSENTIHRVFADKLKVINKNTGINMNINRRQVKLAISNVLLSGACWCFYYENWIDGINYLLQIEKDSLSIIKEKLPEKLGYLASLKFSTLDDQTITNARSFIHDSIISPLSENWVETLGDFPSQRLAGYFLNDVLKKTTGYKRTSIYYYLFVLLKYKPKLINNQIFDKLLQTD